MRTNVFRYGIILNAQNYNECVAFYRDLFELPVLFEKNDGDFQLTCFEYGHGYLMVEQGGTAKIDGKTIEESSFKLRFNVSDIVKALAEIQSWGIKASISENPWGRVINIYDPDGNRVGVRDESGFVQQITA
ncbi:VOC family protein [Halomonas salifodinae]|uniref:VOC family protein n=1 Tax=Halomonas salifodinae TaxID=438745 RepID=A0ABW2F560_9GAMM